MRAVEAAQYSRLSIKTLYQMVKAGKLRVARIGVGRNILFSDELLDADLTALVPTSNPHDPPVRADRAPALPTAREVRP
jgi:excisionase family DNA binding protein